MKISLFSAGMLTASLLFSVPTPAHTTPDYTTLIEQAYHKLKLNHDGKVADYIPALATYSPNNFTITPVTVDGNIYQVGDVKKAFPMESLSKVFTLALEQHGPQEVLDKLGANATGQPFNSGLAVEIYTRQCSVDITVEQLAKMGAMLANGGKSPFNGRQLLNASYVPQVLAKMAIAGLYDGSGKWLYTVGVPAKSSVSGGMVAVVPGRYAITVYSPPLDEASNSVRAQQTIECVADATQANLFLAK